MIYPSTIKFPSIVKDEWLRQTLEREELLLTDYVRPLKKMKKSPNPFTLVSAYNFGRQVMSMLTP